ncbi:hypothetical protein SteCoe_10799 [Stentor coeruleus]|uniref:RING-type domain-containing protein n=1 Tax=Stentor coeruleus TaxID=5963 RepID=A0A1R2CEL5_9CILI|nr:hypothetical protein SteCoe_10799 [Stentor coeruleus]
MSCLCPYCLEPYTSPNRIPLALSCEHILCKQCIEFCQYNQHFTACPFDNLRVDFSSLTLYDSLITDSSLICQIHNRLYKEACITHSKFLCEICQVSHLKCTLTKGKFEDLGDLARNLIEDLKIKAKKNFYLIENFNCRNVEDEIIWLIEDCSEKLHKYKKILEKVTENSNYGIESLIEISEDELEDTKKNIENLKIIYKKTEENIINNIVLVESDRNKEKSIETVALGKLKNKYVKNEGNPKNKALGDLLQNILAEFNALINMSTLIFNINEEEQRIAEIMSQAQLIRLFNAASVMEYTNMTVVLNAKNMTENCWVLNGLGFGLPENPNGYVYLIKLSVSCDEEIFEIENMEINWESGRVTKIIDVTQTIIVNPQSIVKIKVAYEAEDHFIFTLTDAGCPIARSVCPIPERTTLALAMDQNFQDGGNLRFPISYMIVENL